jgi:beta-N-acetylhexosaminidase
MRRAAALVAPAVAAAVLPFALDWRSPALASLRPVALAALILLPLGVMAVAIATWQRSPRAIAAAGVLALGLALADLAATLVHEARFQWQRYRVREADPQELAALGPHIIVGYRDIGELRELVERQAIGGIFLTARNVRDRTAAEIGAELRSLQDERRRQGLVPLWIAADQEGGTVSRLSPPLAPLPALNEILARHPDPAERRRAVQAFAEGQGRGLAALGVNLNFAPVVDLDHGLVNPGDRHTRIHERAIAADAQVVADVATTYCAGLRLHGVHCTLKHFPGLGRVAADTHRTGADLDAPLSELATSDWIPFRRLMASATAFTMVGHARLTALDPAHPASFSPAVIGGLMRDDWGYDGILVTDDVTMGAFYRSPQGIGGGSLAALNAGVDLVLVSFDTDQFYPVMDALVAARRDGRLLAPMLQRSARRLANVKPVLRPNAP